MWREGGGKALKSKMNLVRLDFRTTKFHVALHFPGSSHRAELGTGGSDDENLKY